MLQHANQIFKPFAAFFWHCFQQDAVAHFGQSEFGADFPMQRIADFLGNNDLARSG